MALMLGRFFLIWAIATSGLTVLFIGLLAVGHWIFPARFDEVCRELDFVL